MTEKCRNYCKGLKQLEIPYNRAGLPHIKYRIGTYFDFREFILQDLDRNQVLKDLTYRNPDDPSIALLEGAALLGDILTFYQELYANEAFLRTAQWRESIEALVRLTGYRLSPGLGGTASVAFEVKEGTDVTVAKGFPVKAQLDGGNEPVDFETDKELVAVPALGKFRLYRKNSCRDLINHVSAFSILTSKLEEAGQKIEAGDRLMFKGMSTYSSPLIVPVKKVEKKFNRTYLYIDGYVNFTILANKVTVYKLGKTFRHFGHNAPPFIINLDGNVASKQEIYYYRKVHELTQTLKNKTYWNFPITSFKSTEVPVEGDTSCLSPGRKIIVSGEGFHIEKNITSITPVTMTWGAVTGATTLISLAGPLPNKIANIADIRKILIHEVIGAPFDLENIPGPASDPDGLYYFGDLKTYLKLQNRKLALRKADDTYAETTTYIETQYSSSSETGVTFRRITYKKPETWPFSEADFQLENPTVEVYGNVVDITQGKRQKEVVLGSGDARDAFQTFELPKSPLTYISTENSEHEPRLEVYVNGQMWNRMDTLLDCSSSDKVYIVREDAEGSSWVQFGDGKNGRRLPTGSENITAIYWTGIGAYGEIMEGSNPQAGEKLNKLEKVRLPGIVSGGCEPEKGEKARIAAPGKTQSLGRLVSLKDFEIEALSIPGVQLASAAYSIVRDTPAIILTILMENGREKEINSVRDTISQYNICRGAQRHPVSVIEGAHRYVYIDADIGRDMNMKWQVVEKNILEALGAMGDEGNGTDSSHGLFSVGMRGFGEGEYATRIAGIIQNAGGVIWVKVRYFSAITPNPEGQASAENLPIPSEPVLNDMVGCDRNSILCLHSKHLSLHEITTSHGGLC